jgi:hypothetical protein
VSPEVLPPQSASPRAFDRCQGRLGTPSLLASATSPVYRFRSRLDQQTFVSSAAVLPAGALARRYVEAAARPSVAACERDSLKDLIRRARSRDRRVAFTDVHLVPVTPSAPASYRDAVPYRAAGVRLKLVLVLTGHRGRRLRVPFYEQELVFLYRRAVVALIATATRTPISAATWRYLESTMVGRAEANWGHPQTSARPPAIAGHGSATAS